jgi:hypothetical protein
MGIPAFASANPQGRTLSLRSREFAPLFPALACLNIFIFSSNDSGKVDHESPAYGKKKMIALIGSRFAGIVLLLLFMPVFAYIFTQGGEAMNRNRDLAVLNTALPLIDLAQPKNTETATFSLG